MFGHSDIEKHSESNENKLNLIELQVAALDKEIAEFLAELKITPEKLTSFIKKQDNFTTENWGILQKEKKILEDKLQLSLKNIPNPRKAKKTYAERHIGSGWLFVK